MVSETKKKQLQKFLLILPFPKADDLTRSGPRPGELSFFVFTTLAMAARPKTPPKLSQAPPEPPLGRNGAREGSGSILERPRPRALKYDK